MNELDELARFRTQVPSMSQRARLAGRRRLDHEMGRTRPAPALRRRIAMATLIVVGLVLLPLAAPVRQQPNAAAAEVLRAAADFVDRGGDLTPRPDQFLFYDIRQVTGSGLKTVVQLWESADGTRQGLTKITGDITNSVRTVAPYTQDQGLGYAPYLELAKLPTDPDQLLQRLREDPVVDRKLGGPLALFASQAAKDLAVWELLRRVLPQAPGRIQAALLRVAARLPGLVRTDGLTDAAGHGGIAVGMADPRIGVVYLLFDKDTHRYLGAPISKPGNPREVEFNETTVRTAVVDRAGQLPG